MTTESATIPVEFPENLVLKYPSTAFTLVDANDQVVFILPRGRSPREARTMAESLGLSLRMAEINVTYEFVKFGTTDELTRYNYTPKRRGA